MIDRTPHTPSSGYQIRAANCRSSPLILKSILETWCVDHCIGRWETSAVNTRMQHTSDYGSDIFLTLEEEGDVILFMMSTEYEYMGNPPLTK